MPYIAIKGFPKDEETVRRVAERINEAMLELWGCPQEAVSISYEAIPREQWEERMERGELAQKGKSMLLRAGKWVSRGKKLTFLHLDGCPYCRSARAALEELQRENPAYRAVETEWIEEQRQSEAASRYTDYYYVPTAYAGETKLFETQPGDDYATIKANVKRALDALV